MLASARRGRVLYCNHRGVGRCFADVSFRVLLFYVCSFPVASTISHSIDWLCAIQAAEKRSGAAKAEPELFPGTGSGQPVEYKLGHVRERALALRAARQAVQHGRAIFL